MLRSVNIWCALLLTLVFAGCATPPPPRELLDARAAYHRAEAGDASRLAPAELYEAKVALTAAEQAFQDDPESEKTLTLAYVAQRAAQLVETQASIKSQQEQRKIASEKITKIQTEGIAKSKRELSQAREKLVTKDQQLENTGKKLEEERKAREQAERLAAESLQRVAEAAKLSVKQDERGMVITMPGSVLFSSGESSLLPTAQQKLALLAEQLKNQKTAIITVEGHTDARGSDAENMTLSQARADSVRTYLVSQGIPPEQVRATGMGETHPVASNGTAEGRAENRRVEIVVTPGELK